jgi:hypothetical protein
MKAGRICAPRQKPFSEKRLLSMVDNDSLIALRTAKSDDSNRHARRCFSAACSSGPENTGTQLPEKSLFAYRHLRLESQLHQCSRKVTIDVSKGRLCVFSVNETCFGRDGMSVYRYSWSSELVVCTIELEDKGHRIAPTTLSSHRRLFADVRRQAFMRQRGVSPLSFVFDLLAILSE